MGQRTQARAALAQGSVCQRCGGRHPFHIDWALLFLPDKPGLGGEQKTVPSCYSKSIKKPLLCPQSSASGSHAVPCTGLHTGVRGGRTAGRPCAVGGGLGWGCPLRGQKPTPMLSGDGGRTESTAEPGVGGAGQLLVPPLQVAATVPLCSASHTPFPIN